MLFTSLANKLWTTDRRSFSDWKRKTVRPGAALSQIVKHRRLLLTAPLKKTFVATNAQWLESVCVLSMKEQKKNLSMNMRLIRVEKQIFSAS